MAGRLTIDAEGVRTVAGALGNIDIQVKNDADQLTWNLSVLDSVLQYSEIGITTQLRQALNSLNQVSQLLQTAQTRLLTVVNDTLQLEQAIDGGSLAGRGGDPLKEGGDGNDGFLFGQGGQATWKEWQKTLPGGGVLDGKLLTGEGGYGLQVKDGNINAGLWGSGSVASGSATFTGNNYMDQAQAKFLTGEGGVGFQEENGNINAGAWVGASVLDASDQGRFGSKNLGITGGLEGQLLSGDAWAGVHDSSAGFDVGASWASASGSVGTDIAGVNLGVNAGVEAGINFGVEIGKHTEIKLGPFQIGFNIGGAF